MGFLGSVILSFAFSMFKQRKLVKKHAAEIFTAVIVSTVFSLYSTALVGRLVDENSRDGGGKDPIVGSVRELCLIIDRFGMINLDCFAERLSMSLEGNQLTLSYQVTRQ
ncbi:unnamed protein product [Arabidopsis halleri]